MATHAHGRRPHRRVNQRTVPTFKQFHYDGPVSTGAPGGTTRGRGPGTPRPAPRWTRKVLRFGKWVEA